MKKKLLLISSILLTLGLITAVIFNNIDNKENNIISNITKDEPVISSNMITMMYETEAGSGEYTETKDNTWPESGYIFNEKLSGCENGGELEYNSQNNTVNLLSNKSDACYVYFDKYDGVWIDNVVATNVTGSSVTLDVSATSENGNITTYYYALNDSEEYQESTSNVITINDLNKLTEYKISIYAIDSTNAKSNIYELSVSTTDIYIPVINSVEVNDITTSGFTLTVNVTSEYEISKYYFTIDGNGEYNAGTSTTNTFTFNTLEDGINYNILVFVETVNNTFSEKYEISAETKKILTLANYIKSLYISQGSNGIYYHISSLTNGAGDNSYRYAGANPNNYVCFGSDISPCPNENLYRIIGVFGDNIKLIKKESIGSLQWDEDNSHAWDSDTNPTIKQELNTEFYDDTKYFSSTKWKNMLSIYDWQVGGGYYNYLRDAKAQTAYNYEIGQNSKNIIDSMKIGLMYVSDYGYATLPTNWSTNLGNYSNTSVKNNNWLFYGYDEWTISSTYSTYGDVSFSGSVLYVNSSGKVNLANASINKSIRPAFYLKTEVTYISGDGSEENPLIIDCQNC